MSVTDERAVALVGGRMVQVGPVSLLAAVLTGFWVLPPPDAWRLAAKLGTVAFDSTPPSPPREIIDTRRRRTTVVCAPCLAPVCPVSPAPVESASSSWGVLGGCCLAVVVCGGAAGVSLQARAPLEGAEAPVEAEVVEEDFAREVVVRRGPVTRRTRVTRAAGR